MNDNYMINIYKRLEMNTLIKIFSKLIFPLQCNVQKSVDKSWLLGAVELAA